MFKSAEAKISTTTIERTSEAIAALLSLPDDELAWYRNKSYYVSSFELSQNDIFQAVKRATGTNDTDWSITERDAVKVIEESRRKIQESDDYAEWYRLFVMSFQGVPGANYENKKVDLRKYGLKDEDLDMVVKRAVANL